MACRYESDSRDSLKWGRKLLFDFNVGKSQLCLTFDLQMLRWIGLVHCLYRYNYIKKNRSLDLFYEVCFVRGCFLCLP